MSTESTRAGVNSKLVLPILAFIVGSAAGVYGIYLQGWGLVFELAWVLLLACVLAIYLDRTHLR